jgi:hypothetical protein
LVSSGVPLIIPSFNLSHRELPEPKVRLLALTSSSGTMNRLCSWKLSLEELERELLENDELLKDDELLELEKELEQLENDDEELDGEVELELELNDAPHTKNSMS